MNDDRTNEPEEPERGSPVPPAPGLLAWLPWLAAVGLALLLGFIGQAYFAARSEMSAMRQQAALADIETQSLRQQLEAERILAAHRAERPAAEERLRIVQLFGTANTNAAGWAVVVWDIAGQKGELAACGLPALPPDQSYRLCIVATPNSEPDLAGTFTVGASAGGARVHLKPARPVADGARFVISIGRAGDAPHASDPVILSSH